MHVAIAFQWVCSQFLGYSFFISKLCAAVYFRLPAIDCEPSREAVPEWLLCMIFVC